MNGSCAAEREDVLKEFYITENQDEERIDRYLAEMLPDCSRSYIQKLIKEKQVCVNRLPVKADRKSTRLNSSH